MAYADVFIPELDQCNEVLNAGSLLFVQNVNCPLDEPAVVTLTVDTDAAAGDTTITLTADDTDGVRLREGSLLHFDAEVVTVVEEVLVTTATDVAVEELTVGLTTGDTAETWGLLQLLSPTNIPTNLESQTVNRTDLSNGLFGSMVKTKVELKPQITVINTPNDRALYEYIFPAAKSDQSIYALIVRSSGIHTFARALINGFNDDGNIEEISRPQFTIEYQGKIGIAAPYKYLSTEEQTALNSVRKLAGLSELSV